MQTLQSPIPCASSEPLWRGSERCGAFREQFLLCAGSAQGIPPHTPRNGKFLPASTSAKASAPLHCCNHHGVQPGSEFHWAQTSKLVSGEQLYLTRKILYHSHQSPLKQLTVLSSPGREAKPSSLIQGFLKLKNVLVLFVCAHHIGKQATRRKLPLFFSVDKRKIKKPNRIFQVGKVVEKVLEKQP